MSSMCNLTIRQTICRGAIFYYEPAITTISGTMIPNPEWIAADCITVQRVDGSLSVIPKRDIVGLPPTIPTPNTMTYAMYGSKGDIYTITDDGRFWSCTCRGYEFRKTCRHIVETKNQVESDNG